MPVLSFDERMIVAPVVGVFRSSSEDAYACGRAVDVGQAIGAIEGIGVSTNVCSPFRGVLAGMLADDGERLRQGEPVAWLRVTRSEI
jgi:biotin carboxyl carrier protein